MEEGWFKCYDTGQLPHTFDQIVQSWDTANKPTELSGYSVCLTLGIKGSMMFVLHVLRTRLNYPDLKRAVLEQAELRRATIVLIEDRASGTQLIQELVHEGCSIVNAVTPLGVNDHLKFSPVRSREIPPSW